MSKRRGREPLYPNRFLGSRIKQSIEESDYRSAAAAAEALGVGDTRLNKWIVGRAHPADVEDWKLLAPLGLTMGEIEFLTVCDKLDAWRRELSLTSEELSQATRQIVFIEGDGLEKKAAIQEAVAAMKRRVVRYIAGVEHVEGKPRGEVLREIGLSEEQIDRWNEGDISVLAEVEEIAAIARSRFEIGQGVEANLDSGDERTVNPKLMPHQWDEDGSTYETANDEAMHRMVMEVHGEPPADAWNEVEGRIAEAIPDEDEQRRFLIRVLREASAKKMNRGTAVAFAKRELARRVQADRTSDDPEDNPRERSGSATA